MGGVLLVLVAANMVLLVNTDVVEPWVPCLNPNDCALPWPQRDRVSGAKWTQCWEEPWCRNWLQQVVAGARPGKRDIFMSRGWGAGGMPFSVLYLNSHMRLKQQQKLRQEQQQLQASARQPRFSPAEGGGGEEAAARTAALVSEARLQDYEEEQAPPPRPPQAHVELRPTGGHKQYAVLPQLFISYGWGPLGK